LCYIHSVYDLLFVDQAKIHIRYTTRANTGEAFDSELTALIMPAKTYSHKFTNVGEFSYFCRVHPTMVGRIVVVP